MADKLLSLRIIVVSPSPGDRALFRNAAAAARVPIELVENDGEAAAGRSLAAGADLAFFDTALGGEAVARIVKTIEVYDDFCHMAESNFRVSPVCPQKPT